MKLNPNKINKKCKYYPCHKKIEKKEWSCAFCYCPFYPCKLEGLGKWLKTGSGRLWDCSTCTLAHDKQLIQLIKKHIKRGKTK